MDETDKNLRAGMVGSDGHTSMVEDTVGDMADMAEPEVVFRGQHCQGLHEIQYYWEYLCLEELSEASSRPKRRNVLNLEDSGE